MIQSSNRNVDNIQTTENNRRVLRYNTIYHRVIMFYKLLYLLTMIVYGSVLLGTTNLQIINLSYFSYQLIESIGSIAHSYKFLKVQNLFLIKVHKLVNLSIFIATWVLVHYDLNSDHQSVEITTYYRVAGFTVIGNTLSIILSVIPLTFYILKHLESTPNQAMTLNQAIDFTVRISQNSETVDSCCTICLENFKVDDHLAELSCSHKFHHTCLQQWINNGKITCPICRKTFHDLIN